MRELAKSRLYLHRPCSMMITLFEIDRGVDLDRFRVAIAEAMNRHEQLKSKITLHTDGRAYYEPINRAVVKVDIETYEPAEDEDEESLLDIAFEWAQEAVRFSLDLGSGELMRHILIGDGVSTVWGIASHYLAGDAPSLQYLARDVFACLDDSSLKLSPLAWQEPADEHLPSEQSLAWPAKLRVKRMNKLWAREGKAFTWPDLARMQENFHAAWPLHTLHASLEPEVVRALRELARREDVHFCTLIAGCYVKATTEKDPVSILVDTRPDGFEGVGTYQGGVSLDISKIRGEQPLLTLAKNFSAQMDENMKDPQKLHHAAIVLLGISESLIDSGYYYAYDGLNAKSAEQMAQLYGLTRAGTGMQLSNLKIIPAEKSYAFGAIRQVYVIPPMAPNFSRSISLVSTPGERLGIAVNFYQDESYENFLLRKVCGMLKEAVGLEDEDTADSAEE